MTQTKRTPHSSTLGQIESRLIHVDRAEPDRAAHACAALRALQAQCAGRTRVQGRLSQDWKRPVSRQQRIFSRRKTIGFEKWC